MSDANSNALLGQDRGVTVALMQDQSFVVEVPYDRALVARMRAIEGAAFDKQDSLWKVPADKAQVLADSVEDIRRLNFAISQDRSHIMALATASAVERQQLNGANDAVVPKVGDFIKKGTSYNGEILNVNGHYAAQLTGFGKDDGAAFVTVHRLANLDKSVFKGNNLRLSYNDRGDAQVIDRNTVKSQDDVLNDFDQSLEQTVDGVTVKQAGDQYLVSFAFNPTLRQRLQRVDGVEFDDGVKAFAVPMANREFVARAVHEMRAEFVTDLADREKLSSLANGKIDGANVRDAYTKDGFKHFGEIIGTNDRYALQYGGKDDFKLHRLANLEIDGSNKIKAGDDVTITYDKGRGAVAGRDKDSVAPAAPAVAQNQLPAEAIGSVEHKTQALIAADKGPANGQYIGKITGIDEQRGIVYQSMGRGVSEPHLTKALSRVPKVGELATIQYKEGQGKVADPKQQAQSQGQTR